MRRQGTAVGGGALGARGRSRRKSTLWLLLTLAAVFSGVVLLLLRDHDPEITPAEGEWGSFTDPTPSARLRGTGAARQLALESVATAAHIAGVVRRGPRAVEAQVEVRRADASLWPPSDAEHERVPRPSRRDLLPRVLTSPPLAIARSDGEGRFRLPVPGVGSFEVIARAEGGLAARRRVTVPAIGSEAHVVLELPAGEEVLTGRVEYEDGRPFVGRVLLERGQSARIPWGGYMPPCWSVPTDGEGRFRVAGLPRGSFALTVIDPGLLRLANCPVQVPHEGEVRILVPSEVTCRGRVVDAESHAPLGGARITAVGHAWTGRTALVHAATDAHGGFAIAGPVLQVSVSVEVQGYVPLTRSWAQFPKEDITLGLKKGGCVRGRVVERGTGVPVAGIPVIALPSAWEAREEIDWFFPPPRHFTPRYVPLAVRTDPQGRFTFPGLPAGPTFVFAWGPGWSSLASSATEEAEAPARQFSLASGEVRVIELTVRPTARIRGRVRDAAGRPVAGADVRVLSGGGLSESSHEDLGEAGAGLFRTVSGGDGTFCFDAVLPDGDFEVRVVSRDHLPASVTMDGLPSGGEAEVEVTLRSGRWLDIGVVSEQGRAVGGAVVEQRLDVTERAWGTRRRTWATDANGRTRAGPFAYGELRLLARAPDHVQPRRSFTDAWTTIASALEDTGDAEVTLVVSAGHALSGRVLGPPGAPLERVGLTLDPWDWPRHVPLSPVASDGSWSVPGGLDTPFSSVYAVLHWQGRIYVGTSTARPDVEDNVVELREVDDMPWSSRVRRNLRVLDQTGRPVAFGHAMVLTRFEGEPYCSSPLALSPDGASMHVFPAPPFWVEVWGVPGPWGGGGRFGPFERLEEEHTLRLEATCSIQGCVLDAGGDPVPGLRVAVHGCDACEDRDPTRAVCITDAEGAFLLTGLGPIEYMLHLHPSFDFEKVPPIAAHGGATNLEIVLERCHGADLTVLDPEGRPVRSCRLEAKADSPGEHVRSAVCASTDRQGQARLRGLDTETTYTLQLTPPKRDDPLLPQTVEGWLPQQDTIHLRRSLSIEGRVVDLSRRPFADARVRCWSRASRETETTTSSEDGAFRFDRLPVGAYRVWADVGEISAAKYVGSEVLDVAAGSEGLVVRLDKGGELTVRLEGYPEGALDAELHAERPHLQWRQRFEGCGERVFRFRGLSADAKYTLWIHAGWHGAHEEVYVFERHLAAGDSVTVHARRSLGVSGRLLFPCDVRTYSSSISVDVHGIRIYGDQNTRHEFEIPGVPPGTFRVEASIQTPDGVEWGGEGLATPGTPVDLTMEILSK